MEDQKTLLPFNIRQYSDGNLGPNIIGRTNSLQLATHTPSKTISQGCQDPACHLSTVAHRHCSLGRQDTYQNQHSSLSFPFFPWVKRQSQRGVLYPQRHTRTE